MPAYNIKGITVEIGGDTKNFNTALSELNGKISSSSREIGKLNRLLKLDPTNTVLLAQKQELLSKEIAASKDKLTALQQAKKAVDADMQNGTEVNQEEYRKLCREIESTTKNIEIMTATYDDQRSWQRRALHNIANSGQFSSDRTIREYASEIWGL